MEYQKVNFKIGGNYNINTKQNRMLGSLQNTSQSFCQIQREEKQYHFRNMLRSRYIEGYRDKIRKQRTSRQIIDKLIGQIPNELPQVEMWCKKLMDEFSIMKDYKFPDAFIYDFFKMIQTYPNSLTIKLLYIVSHKISANAINILFQFYDIMKFLTKIISFPEKLASRDSINNELKFVQIQIVRDCLRIISQFCEVSERARNYMILNHQCFKEIMKAEKRFTEDVQNEIVLCLYSFTTHPMTYNEEFIKVIKQIMFMYTNPNYSKRFEELKLLAKALRNIMKIKQRWALDIVQSKVQYDLTETSLQILRACQSCEDKSYHKLDELVHNVNMFLVFYIESSLDQYFPWEEYFREWLNIIHINQYEYHTARRDIYYIFNSVIQIQNSDDSDYTLASKLIHHYHLIEIMEERLRHEINSDTAYEVCCLIRQVAKFSKRINIFSTIVNSKIINTMMQAVLGDYACLNTFTKQILLQSIQIMLQNSVQMGEQQFYRIALNTVHCYGERLNNLFNNCVQKSNVSDQMVQCLQALQYHYSEEF